ncbi:hypothetical protein TeGR_g15122, partial [Tetraparma gracilis]
MGYGDGQRAFWGCTGLRSISWLENSQIDTIWGEAFQLSAIASLQGIELVRMVGPKAFARCDNLRSIEGLGCEVEIGNGCFQGCRLLQWMKGWPASMTVISAGTFDDCTGMTTVDCDLVRVTSIGVHPVTGAHAFAGCTSLLPPSLSEYNADPAAVLAFLKRKSILERAPERRTFLCSLKHAQSNYYDR